MFTHDVQVISAEHVAASDAVVVDAAVVDVTVAFCAVVGAFDSVVIVSGTSVVAFCCCTLNPNASKTKNIFKRK